MKQPDPKLHLIISLGKSAFRIAACFFLASSNVLGAGILFGLAELLGILEELV